MSSERAAVRGGGKRFDVVVTFLRTERDVWTTRFFRRALVLVGRTANLLLPRDEGMSYTIGVRSASNTKSSGATARQRNYDSLRLDAHDGVVSAVIDVRRTSDSRH